ncbi:MAG: EamA family transporter [Elusimicrobia bacterium]|nr:EamA family transporter [Elusimicrobiota bacterium]
MEKRSGGKKLLTDIGLFYCAAIWGSTFIVVKSALNSVNPVVMVGIRFFISALLLLPWVLKRKNKTAMMKEGFVLACVLACLYLSQTTGLLYTTASNSGFITGLFIIFIPAFMFIFRRKELSRLQWVSAILAVAGMWLLTGGISGLNRGDALALAAAAAYAAHLIITDRYVKAEADPVMLAFHQFWMVAVISFILAGAAGCPMGVAGLKGWGVIIFLAVFPTLIAFYIQMLAQKESEPFKVGLIFTLEPVFAAIFAWTWGGERFIAVKAAGGFLIVSAMLIGELSKLNFRRAAKAA